MSPDQQANLIADFESILREKRRADDGKLKTLDNYDVIREIVNVDAPRAVADTMSYLDRHNKLELLAELKSKETFVETAIAALSMMEEGKIIIK